MQPSSPKGRAAGPRDTRRPVTGNAPEIRRSAVLSDCGRYRYLLARDWATTGRPLSSSS